MGLAPYGEPHLSRNSSATSFIDLQQDGSFRLNLDYFAFHHDRP
ncbi:MAG: hypothetical protein QM760_05370 [Nibricoccus sp.]